MSIHFHVYSNGGAGGPVDLSTPIATVSSPTYTPSALATPSDNTFLIRSFDTVSGLEEQNVVVSVRIVVSASGVDISGLPAPPASLGASPLANGGARVRWTFDLPVNTTPPTGFHVYIGTPTADLTTPVRTVPWYRQRRRYATGPDGGVLGTDITGLSGGTTYQVVVRAYNAVGIEQNTGAISLVGLVSGPSNVDGISATAGP